MQERRLIRSTKRKRLVEDYQRTRKVVKEELRAHGEVVRRELEKETSDWKSQPRFIVRVIANPQEMRVTVRPDRRYKSAKIFKYVDEGTVPHVIKPVKAKALRFNWGGYGSVRPKTAPAAGPARLSSGAKLKTVFRQRVNHPGNEPRHITKRVSKRTRPQFRRRMENTLRRLVRASQ